jgi:hypothetical protein
MTVAEMCECARLKADASGVKQMIYNSMHRDFERRYDLTVVQPTAMNGPPGDEPLFDWTE